jgi:GNAT superfamily N-acetyltransferase
VRVRPVANTADLKAFIDLPYRLHRQLENWVPPLRRDVANLLDRSKNPFFDHAEATYFLCERDGQVVGRVAAISNRLHNETHGDAVGFFGFFESIDDPEVASALLAAASDELRRLGHDRIRGPMSFSVNDECGLLVDGFESSPSVMMPYNPDYYGALLEGCGLEGVKELLAYRGGHPDSPVTPPERLRRGTEILRRRLGIELRPARLSDFPAEVERVRTLFNATWSENWGFVPMTERELSHAAADFKPVVIPDLLPFAMKDGREIGFALAVPDINLVLRSHRSGRMFPAALDLLWKLKRRHIGGARVLLLGILPEFRGRGIDAMLYHWLWSKAAENGISWGEAGWVLEDNAAMSAGLVKMGFEVVRRYRVYERALAPAG